MKHTPLVALLVTVFCIHQTAYACINEFAARLDGKLTESGLGSYKPRPAHDLSNKEQLQRNLHIADSLCKASGNLAHYNDYGVQLIFNGKFEEAKAVFVDIEKKHPGIYQTATNLGTIYEVLGKNDSALIWIKKGIKRNPDSHNGSEWIHVRILEAKLNKNDNWKYLNNHSLLKLNFGTTETPIYKGKVDLRELAAQIETQLSERISFIPPKDPIIAQLLFDLGNTVAIIEEVESALSIYKMAEEYGYSSDVLKTRKKHFIALNKRAKVADEVVPIPLHKPYIVNAVPYAVYALIAILFAAVPYWIYNKRKKQGQKP